MVGWSWFPQTRALCLAVGTESPNHMVDLKIHPGGAVNDEPTPTNGKPYYCALCGAGFGEYLACELPDCELESEDEARERMTIPEES